MPKKIKNCFYNNLTFNKMYEAHLRARKHKAYKAEVIKFEFNLENNLINLINNIKNENYHLGKYYEFKVYEPKERTIKALPYIDRIVHQWYVEEFIKPNIIPKLINTTFACIPDRGTHKAVSQIEHYMRIHQNKNPNFWVLKCDIRKFFYCIDPNILYKIMQKYISDKALLKFTHLLIFDKNLNNTKGIPIGNYTSQFFANIYLNELDQYVKRVLKVKYYVRYMDDFILLLDNKLECKVIKNKIEEFLHTNLELDLNCKSKYFPNKMGVDFCGYRTFCTHRLLRTSSKIKIKNKVKKWNKQFNKNCLPIKNTIQSLSSWVAHSSHCNSYHLQKQIINKCNFLVNDTFYKQIEENLLKDMEQKIQFPNS